VKTGDSVAPINQIFTD